MNEKLDRNHKPFLAIAKLLGETGPGLAPHEYINEIIYFEVKTNTPIKKVWAKIEGVTQIKEEIFFHLPVSQFGKPSRLVFRTTVGGVDKVSLRWDADAKGRTYEEFEVTGDIVIC